MAHNLGKTILAIIASVVLVFNATTSISPVFSISEEEIDIKSAGFEALVEVGLDKYKKYFFEEAIVYFDKALGFDPDNSQVLNLKGISLVKLEKYANAVSIYDDIIETDPTNTIALKNKAVALSKLERHSDSIIQFYKVLEINRDDVQALNGMGVGFGSLGEYADSLYFFEKALEIDSSNKIASNYKDYVTTIKAKYYPDQESVISLKIEQGKSHVGSSVPSWIKNNAKWWSEGNIGQSDFLQGIQYLVKQNIIKVIPKSVSEEKTAKIPDWVKNTAGWWSNNQISDKEFLSSIEFLIANGIIQVGDSSDSTITLDSFSQQIDEPFLKKHLNDVTKNIAKEKRYIESPNPSWELKKKYLRDVEKWNLEQQIQVALNVLPDPTYTEEDGKVTVYYNVYINDQPPGLPFDYIPTLDKALDYWASQDFTWNDKPTVFNFTYTNDKYDANVWVMWIVRDIEALGHATLGKGIVEVTIGNFACNGDFELLDLDTVEYIMKHEIGHSIALQHSTDRNSIMYPSVTPSYGYCIISDIINSQ